MLKLVGGSVSEIGKDLLIIPLWLTLLICMESLVALEDRLTLNISVTVTLERAVLPIVNQYWVQPFLISFIQPALENSTSDPRYASIY